MIQYEVLVFYTFCHYDSACLTPRCCTLSVFCSVRLTSHVCSMPTIASSSSFVAPSALQSSSTPNGAFLTLEIRTMVFTDPPSVSCAQLGALSVSIQPQHEFKSSYFCFASPALTSPAVACVSLGELVTTPLCVSLIFFTRFEPGLAQHRGLSATAATQLIRFPSGFASEDQLSIQFKAFSDMFARESELTAPQRDRTSSTAQGSSPLVRQRSLFVMRYVQRMLLFIKSAQQRTAAASSAGYGAPPRTAGEDAYQASLHRPSGHTLRPSVDLRKTPSSSDTAPALLNLRPHPRTPGS